MVDINPFTVELINAIHKTLIGNRNNFNLLNVVKLSYSI